MPSQVMLVYSDVQMSKDILSSTSLVLMSKSMENVPYRTFDRLNLDLMVCALVDTHAINRARLSGLPSWSNLDVVATNDLLVSRTVFWCTPSS